MKTLCATLGTALLLTIHPLSAVNWINADGGTFVGPGSNWSPSIPNSSSTVEFIAEIEGNRNIAYTVTLDQDYEFGVLHNRHGNNVTMDLADFNLSYKNSSVAYFNGGQMTFKNGSVSASGNFLVGSATAGSLIIDNTTVNLRTIAVSNASDSDSDSLSQIQITNKGQIIGTGSASMGSDANSHVRHQSLFQIKGVGSSFTLAPPSTNTLSFRVGAGEGSSFNRVEIIEGGSATLGIEDGTSASLVIGNYVLNTSNNSVLVDGTGSSLTIYGGVQIGRSTDTNRNNLLQISNSAKIEVNSNIQINGSSVVRDNRMIVSSGATATLNGTSNRVYYGDLTVDNGTLNAAQLALYNEGRLNFTSGSISIGNLSISAVGTRFGFDLSNGPLTIDISGTLALSTIANVTRVDIFDISAIGSYTLFDFENGTNILADRMILGETPKGFEGELLFHSNQIVLSVTAIPEPGTWFLIGIGIPLIAAGLRRRRTPSLSSSSIL